MTLPQGWEEISFSELTPQDAPIIYGILQPGPDVPSGIPYIRPTEVSKGRINLESVRRTSPAIAERYARSTLRTNDTILSIVGTIGKVAATPAALDGANITQSSCRIRSDVNLVLPEFFRLFLQSPKARVQFANKRLGTAVPRLNIADIREFKIPLPGLPEQRRIVAKLDMLTARLNRARAELSRASGLAKRLREQAVKSAYDGTLVGDKQDSSASCDTSAAQPFPIPVGWIWTTLGGISTIKSGVTLGKTRPDSQTLTEVPYLRVANVQRGSLNLSVVKTIAVTEAEARALALESGDILLNEGGDRDKLGRGWVWEGQIPRCIHQNHVFRARLTDARHSPHYVSLYINEFAQDYFVEHGTQTTNLASVSKDKVAALPIPMAPPDQQQDVVRRVNATFARADRLEAEAARARVLLDRLEAAILARAFRGELVPQDPDDEPASVLLDRIRARRAAAPKPLRRRRAAATSA